MVFKKTVNDNYVTQIECGMHHSLVLTANGKVYGFGDNSHGQIN